MSETKELTFENGYRRLQTIAARLNEEEVPVSEMCDLFAEGKGLETALTGYLDEQRARIEEIERGKGIRAFKIAASASAKSDAADERYSVPGPLSPTADDDIPF